MKAMFQLMSAISEKREALNRYIADTEKPDSGRVNELRSALDKSESEFRAAVAKLEDVKAEPEKRELWERVELRAYMRTALAGGKLEGAEAEANKELQLGDNQVPWEALLPRDEEHRADDATRIDATSVSPDAIGHPKMTTLQRIFRRSRTSFLGMRMPTVGAGEPIYPVMTGGINPDSARSAALSSGAGPSGPFPSGGTVEATAATFVAKTVSPKRISARYKWRLEDSARFPVEDMLRSDLRMVMSQLLDTQVFLGDAAHDNFNGLFRNNAAGPLGVDAAEGTKTDFNQVLTKHYNYVDGYAAGMVNEVRTLMGIPSYTFMATLFQGASGEQLFSLLSRLGINVATWAGVPAAASNVQQAIQTRRGSDCIVPVWQGVTMIRDPYSEAASGQTALTAHMLANIELLRADHWRKVAFKLA